MKKFIIFIVCVTSTMGLYAQDKLLPTVIPPSPEASQMTKHVDVPTNKYTGIPNISIPLHTIKTRELSVPVNLSYHASGLKVDKISTWVGLNWSLNYGGVVNRTVKGKPDEHSGGYYSDNIFEKMGNKLGYGYPPIPLTDNYNKYGKWSIPLSDSLSASESYLNRLARDEIDGEPDIYSFSFNGYSGKFCFDVNQEIVLFSEQNLYIEQPVINQKGNIVRWTLVTGDGTKYIFGSSDENGVEYSNHEIDEEDFSSAWYITKIISADGSETIDYQYSSEKESEIKYQYLKNNVAAYPNYKPKIKEFEDLSQSLIVEKIYPEEINFKNGKVRFFKDTAYVGNEYRLYALDAIEVWASNEKRLTYLLSYYEHDLTTNDTRLVPKKKFSLGEVKVKDRKGNLRSLYKFQYDDRALPPRGSFAQDLWGYYNGETGNESLIPTITQENVAPNEGMELPCLGYPDCEIEDKKRYNFDELVKAKTSLDGYKKGEMTISNANRQPDADKMQAGILKSITYPTGGKAHFEYEPHDFSYFTHEKIKVTKKIRNFKTQIHNHEFIEIPGGQEVDLFLKMADYQSRFSISSENYVIIEKYNDNSDNYELYRSFNTDEERPEYFFHLWMEPGRYKISLVTQEDLGMKCHIRYRRNHYDNVYKVYRDFYKDTSVNVNGLQPYDNISVRKMARFTIEPEDEQKINVSYTFESPTHPKNYSSSLYGYTKVRIRKSEDPSDIVFEKIYYDCDKCEGKGTRCTYCGFLECTSTNNCQYDYEQKGQETIQLEAGKYIAEFIPKIETDYGGIFISFKKFKRRSYNVTTGGNRIRKIKMSDGKGGEIEKEFIYRMHGNDFTVKKESNLNNGFSEVSSGVLIDYPKLYNIPQDKFFYWNMGPNIKPSLPQLEIFGQSQKPMSTTSGSHIGYREVEVRYKNKGKSIFHYSTAWDYPDITFKSYPYPSPISFDWKRGQKLKEIHMDSSNKAIQSKTYTYSELNDVLDDTQSVQNNNTKLVPALVAVPFNNLSSYSSKYTLLSDVSLLQEKTTNRFTESDTISKTERYEYEEKRLKNTITEGSKSEIIESRVYHSEDYSSKIEMIELLKGNHMQDLPIKTEKVIDDKLIKSKITKYNQFGKPREVYQYENKETEDVPVHNPEKLIPGKFSKRVVFHYGTGNQIEQVRKVNDRNIIYKWGNNYTKPVAKIENAELSKVNDLLEDTDNGNLSKSDVDLLRINPLLKDANISTYEHDVLFGIKSQTDPNNVTTFYEYDGFGRLKSIKDNDGNLLKTYDYNFQKKMLPIPVDLKAEEVQFDKINIQWNQVQDSKYNVYRSENTSDKYRLIASHVSENNYTDFNAGPNKRFFYKVTSTRNGLESPLSEGIKVCTPPEPLGLVIGEKAICRGSIHSYSIESVPGAEQYEWSVKGNANILAKGGNSITVAYDSINPGIGKISVKAVNQYNVSTEPSILQYRMIPDVIDDKLELSRENTFVCPYSEQTYSAGYLNDENTSFFWSVPQGVSIVSGQGTKQVQVHYEESAGAISVYAENVCGDKSNPKELEVNLKNQTNITDQPKSQSVCEGSNATFRVSASGTNLNYQWRKNGEDIQGADKVAYLIDHVSDENAGNYDCVVTGDCGKDTSNAVALTFIPEISGDVSVEGPVKVDPNSIHTYSIQLNEAKDIEWEVPSDAEIVSGQKTNTIEIKFGNENGSVSLTASNSCFTESFNKSVNIKSTKPSSVSANKESVHPNDSTTLSVNGGSLGTDAVWKWYSSNCGGTSVGEGSSITVSPSEATTYYVRAEGIANTTSCVSQKIIIRSMAPESISASLEAILPGHNVTLEVNGGFLGTGATWKWYSGSCGGTYVGSGNTLTVDPEKSTTYYLRAEGDANTTQCVTHTVTMLSVKPSSVSASKTSIEPGGSALLTVEGGSLGTGASWKWYSSNCGGTSVGEGSSITVSPSESTTYYVRAEGDVNSTDCVSKAIHIKSVKPESITAPGSVLKGEVVQLSVKGGSLGTDAVWSWYKGSLQGEPYKTTGKRTISETLDEAVTYYVRAEGLANTTSTVSHEIKIKSERADKIGGNGSVNPGGDVDLTAVGGYLGTGAEWKWYKDECGGTHFATGEQITATNLESATTFYLRAEGDANTTNCVSKTVKIRSVKPSGIEGVNSVGPGETVELKVKGGSLGTGASWKWYSGSCGENYEGQGSSITVSPSQETIYYVKAEGDINSTDCVSKAINIKSVKPESITAPGSVLKGEVVQLSVKGGSLGTDAVWSWYKGSLQGEPYKTTGKRTISETLDEAVTYYVRAEGLANTTSTVSHEIKIKSERADKIGGNGSVNPGGDVDLTAVGGYLGTGAEWKWYKDECGGTHFATGEQITATNLESATTFYLRAEGDANTTQCATHTVKMLSVKPSSVLASKTSIEPGGSALLTVEGGSLGTGASWKWYSSNCGGTSVGEGSSITVSPSEATTYYVRAEGDANTTDCVSKTIKINSTKPNSISASLIDVGKNCSTELTVDGGSLGTGATWKWYKGGCNGTYFKTGNPIEAKITSTTTFYVQAAGETNTTSCASKTITMKTPTVTLFPENPPHSTPSDGVTYNFDVRVNGCFNWSALPNNEWISVKKVDDETLEVIVSENTSTTPRNGSFRVSGGGTTDQYQISQEAQLNADFNYTMETSMGRAMVYFSNQSSGSPTSFEWDFHNDGTIDSTEENPSLSLREGEYEIKLTVFKDGERDSIVKTIRIEILQ